MKDIERSIESATRWLLHSGIQNARGKLKGSVNAWYTPRKGYSYAYSEITGYWITTLLFLSNSKKDDSYVERAESAAEWLRGAAGSKGAFMCRYTNPGGFLRHLCTFDNGIILNALCNLYRKTEDEKYLAAACRCAEWIVSMQHRDGSFNAKYDVASKSYIEERHWSRMPGSYHCKVAIGMLNIFDLTNDERFMSCGKRICDWSMNLQKGDGNFITDGREETYMHPHCYTIEGLAAAGEILKNKSYTDSAVRACEWMLKRGQLPSGGIAHNYNSRHFSNCERTDSTAQALRISMLLNPSRKGRKTQQEKMVNRLQEFQSQNEEQREEGGFIYGEHNGAILGDISAHGTMFALQALMLYTQREMNFNWFLYI